MMSMDIRNYLLLIFLSLFHGVATANDYDMHLGLGGSYLYSEGYPYFGNARQAPINHVYFSKFFIKNLGIDLSYSHYGSTLNELPVYYDENKDQLVFDDGASLRESAQGYSVSIHHKIPISKIFPVQLNSSIGYFFLDSRRTISGKNYHSEERLIENNISLGFAIYYAIGKRLLLFAAKEFLYKESVYRFDQTRLGITFRFNKDDYRSVFTGVKLPENAEDILE